MNKLVYLAGGMEYTDNGESWRDDAANMLSKYGINSWDPYKEELNIFDSDRIQKFFKTCDKEKDFCKYRKFMSQLVKYDLNVVKNKADSILIKFDDSVLKGAGTKSEISVATLFDKPVHVWMAGLGLNQVPGWCLGCFSTVAYTLEEAIVDLVNYGK